MQLSPINCNDVPSDADTTYDLQVTLASGKLLAIKPLTCHDHIGDIRCHIADVLQVPAAQITLLHGAVELEDEQPCGDACGLGKKSMVTAFVHPCSAKPSEYESHINSKGQEESGFVVCDAVMFPEQRDININMMPFIIGDIESLPEEVQHYWPIIESCPHHRMELGRVGYLTIQESLVLQGQSHRRAGLHTEAPGVQMADENGTSWFRWGGGFCDPAKAQTRGTWDELLGGIFTASTVDSSCKMWNVRIDDPTEVLGQQGDLEHLRDLLGEGTLLEANQLVWFTDLTPHESLPLAQDTYRQYFRLVTSCVSGWYERHSTANKLGIKPDPNRTQVLTDDKFQFVGFPLDEDDSEED